MKNGLVVFIMVVFMLAFTVPVFAQDIEYSQTAEFDGDISQELQIGHFCNTGASMKEVVSGEGKMTKTLDTVQVAGKTTVSNETDWVTAPDAIKNLTVTSVIKLCAPPKYTYEGAKVDPKLIYGKFSQPALYGERYNESVYDRAAGNKSPSEGSDDDEYCWNEWEAVSQQIWAVQVAADPGYSGNIHQQWEAAYGPYQGWHQNIEWDEDDEGNPIVDDDKWGWIWDNDEREGNSRKWLQIDGSQVGVDFVGDYFNIEQMSRTSSGVHKRFIDISSPWSGAYLHDDMTVTGFSEVEEALAVNNLEAGGEVTPAWWELF